MKKDWKYIAYLAIVIGIFVLVKLTGQKQFDWTTTFAFNDKNPYGAYALYNLVPTLNNNSPIDHSYKTLYELKDSLSTNNVFIVASIFRTEKEDANVLMNHVYNGGHAFISAEYFWGKLSDTLNIDTKDYFFGEENIFNKKDSSYLKLINRRFDTTGQYFYRRDNIHNFFNRFDSLTTTVIARNDRGYAVTIKVRHGKGSFILNSTPLAFTNIYLLSSTNHQLIATTLSYLPPVKTFWTEYYHMGRMESETPLRFILTNEPLAWAYYITILAVIIFMLFEAKRRQRIIPVIKPLANTTLEFVSTIGNLYFQHGDHKNIAEKKIQFLLEQIRTRYLIPTNVINDTFMATLSKKSGKPQREVTDLFVLINSIMASDVVVKEQLVDLNEKIERFFKQ